MSGPVPYAGRAAASVAGLVGLRPHGGFGLVMADPPWSFRTFSDKGLDRSADRHYACMDLDDIRTLPVREVAGRDCLLWLWATSPMLPQALDVMAAWGFSFRTAGWWTKRGASGRLSFGTGYLLRCAGEPFLLGVRGAPRVRSRSVRSVVEAPRREHSRKPDEAYEAAVALAGDVPRLDLFARERRPGWIAWGDQAGLFDGLHGRAAW